MIEGGRKRMRERVNEKGRKKEIVKEKKERERA